MTLLAGKEQALVRPVLFAGEAAARAHLARVIRIYLDTQSTSECRFVGEKAMQFGKSPFTGMTIRPSLLLARFFTLLVFRALTNTSEVFQSDESVGKGVNNALADEMIGIQL